MSVITRDLREREHNFCITIHQVVKYRDNSW